MYAWKLVRDGSQKVVNISNRNLVNAAVFSLQVNAYEFPISSSDYVFHRGTIFVLAYILISNSTHKPSDVQEGGGGATPAPEVFLSFFS